MITLGTAVGYLMLDTSNFKSGFSSALQDLEVFNSKTATTQSKLKGLGSAMTSVGSQLTTKVTLPLVGLGTAAVSISAEFNQAMSAVKAVSGATGEEFDALKEKALDLGASTAFSASEVANGMTEMAKAGWSTQQILDGMSGVLDAAAASGESLGTVSTIVADALTGFGLEAAESTRVADLLAQSANAGTIDISDLGETLKYAAPVAQAFGYNIEDVVTAVTAMSTAGIKGSQAGTSLRTAFLNMASPSDTVAMAMEKLGVSLTDNQGNLLSMKEVLDNLRVSMSQYSQAEQIALASDLAGKNAVSGLLAILNMTQEEYDAISESMYNSSGVADETARTMQDNLAMAMEQLGGAAETLAIRFGDVLTPMVSDVVAWLTSLLEKLGGLDETTMKIVAVIGALVAALGPGLLIGGKLLTMVANAPAALTAIKTGIAALTGPFGIAIAAVVAFTAAWATNFGGIRDITSEVLGAISSLIKTWLGIIKSLWESDFKGIRSKLTLAFNVLKAIVTAGLNVIEGVVKVFTGVLTLNADMIVDGLKTLTSSALNLIKDLFIAFKDYIVSVFTKDWEATWETIKEIVFKVWDTIKTVFGEFLNFIVDALISIGANLYVAAKNAFQRIKDGFKEKWEAIKEWLGKAKEDPIGTINDLKEDLYSAAKQAFQKLWDGFKDKWKNIKEWFKGIGEWITEKLQFWKDSVADAEAEADNTSNLTSGEGSSGTVGSYAKGLTYVPYDGFPAILHKGERVLTKTEASAYNSGQSGATYNFTFNSPTELSPAEQTRQFKKAMNQILFSM